MHVLQKNKWVKLLFAGPAFLLFSYFIIIATGQTVYYSFTKWKGLGEPVFRGWDNYIKLFQTEDFYIVMRNNLVGLVLALIIQLGLGLIFAYLIYRTVKGMRVFRSLSFVPVVMSGAAVALMFSLIFDGNLGPLNQVLKSIGLTSWTRNWLSLSPVCSSDPFMKNGSSSVPAIPPKRWTGTAPTASSMPVLSSR